MRRFKFVNVCCVFLLSVVILSLIGADLASARWINYSFVNRSGRTIKNLYISQAGYRYWGDDMLGNSVLSHGSSWSMRYNNTSRYFDIKVVWMDGSSVTWDNYDFRGMWRLTLRRRGSRYSISKN